VYLDPALTVGAYSEALSGRLFTVCKLSTANLRTSLRHLPTKLREVPCEFYEIFKIRKNSFYRKTSNCKVFEFVQQRAVDYTEATVEWEHWAVMIEDCDSDTGEDSEAAGDS